MCSTVASKFSEAVALPEIISTFPLAPPPLASAICESTLGATHPPGPAAPQPKATCKDTVPEPIVGAVKAVNTAVGAFGSRGRIEAAVPLVDAVPKRINRTEIPLMEVNAPPRPVT